MNDRILDLIEKALQLAERLVVVEEKKELRLQSYADEKLAPKKKKANPPREVPLDDIAEGLDL